MKQSTQTLEKISALEMETFFTERAKNADLKTFRKILFRAKGESSRTGDVV